MISKKDILEFVDKLDSKSIKRIYMFYHPHNCGNLMDSPVYPETLSSALVIYLDYFINQVSDDEERCETLSKCILEDNIQEFEYIMTNDQYFFEPLYNILNNGKTINQ